MGFRFRKSIKILPGTRLNVSKSGVGISTGVKGARISTGPSGTRVTTSIPGTGIYNVQNIGAGKSKPAAAKAPTSIATTGISDAQTISGSHGNSAATENIKTGKSHGRYYVPWWRAIIGFITLYLTFSAASSGIEWIGVVVLTLIFLAVTVLLFLPWVTGLITLISAKKSSDDD